MDSLRRGTDDNSVLEAYNALSQEQRDELLAQGVDRLRQEPLILRLAETPAEAHELLLKIAPELEGVPSSSSSFDVIQLLRGACSCSALCQVALTRLPRAALLDGTENNGVLPPVAEPADRSAAAVAQHQVALLRHEIRHVCAALLCNLARWLCRSLLLRSRSTILSKFVAHVLLPQVAPVE